MLQSWTRGYSFISDCTGRGYFINDLRVIMRLKINITIGKTGQSRSLQIDVPIYLLSAVLSAAAVVLLALSVIIFITGYACGHCQGRKITKGTHKSKTEHPRQIPLYDDILPSAETNQAQALKLKGNVAYKSTITEDQ